MVEVKELTEAEKEARNIAEVEREEDARDMAEMKREELEWDIEERIEVLLAAQEILDNKKSMVLIQDYLAKKVRKLNKIKTIINAKLRT